MSDFLWPHGIYSIYKIYKNTLRGKKWERTICTSFTFCGSVKMVDDKLVLPPLFPKFLKCWTGFKFKRHETEVEVKVAQSCPTLCDPMDPILQARILKWVALPFSRAPSQPRNWTGVSCIAGGFFTNWAIRESLRISKRFKISFVGIRQKKNQNIFGTKKGLKQDALYGPRWVIWLCRFYLAS